MIFNIKNVNQSIFLLNRKKYIKDNKHTSALFLFSSFLDEYLIFD